MMIDEGSPTPRSPEAKVGMQVEDLWDVQEPQLTPTEKLNACFESIPVSDFPPAPSDEGDWFGPVHDQATKLNFIDCNLKLLCELRSIQT